jgi:hypothetical protein
MDSKQEYKDAIEVSVIFHEGQRMLAVPKQPAPVQEPVAWGNFKEDGTLVGLSQHPEDQKNWTNRKPLYTTPPAQVAPVQPVQELEHITDGGQCWCNPDIDYIDPNTGAAVIVHKEPQ